MIRDRQLTYPALNSVWVCQSGEACCGIGSREASSTAHLLSSWYSALHPKSCTATWHVGNIAGPEWPTRSVRSTRIASKKKIYELIAGYENVERCILIVADFLLTPELPECCSVLDITPIGNCFQLRHEASQFLLPVMKRRGWSDD